MSEGTGRIELRGVSKGFGAVQVIHGVDLDIAAGELVVFVGPSGCGKSTLLRLIAGLDEPTGGEIRIDGRVVNRVRAADRGLAMVFQSYALYPHMTVRQNLAFGLENAAMARDEIARRIRAAAEMLRIDQLLDRRPGQLSGGQRQRVAIGRAIVRDPVAFLLDEPLSNLDAELRVSTRAEIAALHDRVGRTMIYVTHDQVEAMTLADRIVVLRAGRIEQVGSPLELYNRPQNRFVAGFIGAPHMNFLPATVAEDRRSLRLADGAAILLPGTLPLAAGAALEMGVRPHHLRLAGHGEGLVGTARLVEALGPETVLHVETPAGGLVAVLQGQRPIRAGEPVALDFEPEAIHLFGPDGRRVDPVPG